MLSAQRLATGLHHPNLTPHQITNNVGTNTVFSALFQFNILNSIGNSMNIKIVLPLLLLCGFVFCSAGELRAQVAGGPGTEMTQIINRIGLGSDCWRCKSLAAEMDQNGSDWVQQNFDYVVNRTIGNAENLGHNMGPLRRTGVRMIVRRSIQRGR